MDTDAVRYAEKMERSENVKAMRARIEQLQAKMEPIANEIAQWNRAILIAKSPFKVGEEIEYEVGNQVRQGIVREMIPWVGCVQWRVVRRLKDGRLGNVEMVRPYQDPKSVYATRVRLCEEKS